LSSLEDLTMLNVLPRHAARAGWAAWAGLMAAGAVQASDSAGAARVPLLPAYQQECGACHLAYPPGLLPAPSWQRLMGGLGQHFGTDATLDAASARQIGAWLQAHAGTGRRVSAAPPEDRITRSPWFVRKHDEVSAATWKRASIQSPANCAACHRGAEQGDFDEDRVRIPR
jgi:Dihaem cytochrome c